MKTVEMFFKYYMFFQIKIILCSWNQVLYLVEMFFKYYMFFK